MSQKRDMGHPSSCLIELVVEVRVCRSTQLPSLRFPARPVHGHVLPSLKSKRGTYSNREMVLQHAGAAAFDSAQALLELALANR
jgi:hypothetical protein